MATDSPPTGSNGSQVNTPRRRRPASGMSHDDELSTPAPARLVLDGPDALRYSEQDDAAIDINATPHGQPKLASPRMVSVQPAGAPVPGRTSLLGISTTTWHWLVGILLFCYMVLIPFVLIQIYYISFVTALVIIVGSTIPTIGIMYLTYNQQTMLASDDVPTRPLPQQLYHLIDLLLNKWQYELYQLLLTLIACASYTAYTRALGYQQIAVSGSSTPAYHYTLNLPSFIGFIELEYFLIVGLSLDYLLHYIVSSNKFGFLWSMYSLVDLACFTGVAYFSLVAHDMVEVKTSEVYNIYLFSAPFRFLRTRRALKTLDKPQRHTVVRQTSGGRRQDIELTTQSDSTTSSDIVTPIARRSSVSSQEVFYRLGPFLISQWRTKVILLTLKVTLFVLSTAALVLAVEFPCIAVVDDPTTCRTDLQNFHIAMYFTVVTLATVGYGDLYCATGLGRVLMTVVIVGAIIQVPVELNNISAVRSERDEQLKQQRAQAEGGETEPAVDGHVNTSNDMQSGNDDLLTTNSMVSKMYHSNDIDTHDATLQTLLVWAELQLLRAHSPDTIVQLAETLKLDSDQHDAAAVVRTLFRTQKAFN